jgi:hypothetical protein
MSRLDDELRQAFRREEPSPDFTARVMKAVAAAPSPKRRWWDELLARLTTPTGRWVAVGATVSLLAAVILATQFSQLEQATPKGPEAAHETSSPAPPTTPEDGKGGIVANSQKETELEVERQAASSPRKHREQSKRRVIVGKSEAPKSEGEIARDQLMLALHVASASLNEAQRIVSVSEGHQPRTVSR